MKAKTIIWSIVLLAVSAIYWSASLFAAFGGPVDDVAFLAFLVPVIIGHALSFGRSGVRPYRSSSFALAALLTIILTIRFTDISHRGGHDLWHAFRSVHVLFWSYVWFGIGHWIVSWRHRRYLLRTGQLTPSEAKPKGHDY